MKKYLFYMFLLVLTGCMNDFDNGVDQYVDLGVLSHSGDDYLIITDSGIKLMAKTLPVELDFDDNIRVSLKYTISQHAGEDEDFDHWILVDQIQEITTHDIIVINDENRDTLGNAASEFHNVWITEDFLTVYMSFYVGSKEHYFNLTYDENEQTDSNTINLTFRHGDNDDVPAYLYSGYISFRLNSLRYSASNEVNITFRGKQFNNDDYVVEDLIYSY